MFEGFSKAVSYISDFFSPGETASKEVALKETHQAIKGKRPVIEEAAAMPGCGNVSGYVNSDSLNEFRIGYFD